MWTEMWTVNKEGNRGWSPGQRITVPTTNRAYKRRIAEHHFQTSYCHSPFVNPTFLRPFHWRIGMAVSIHVLFTGIGHEVRNGLTWVAGHSVRENGHFKLTAWTTIVDKQNTRHMLSDQNDRVELKNDDSNSYLPSDRVHRG